MAQPPAGLAPAGRTVCNCFGVADSEIKALLGLGLGLEQGQAQLKCGFPAAAACRNCAAWRRRW